MKARQSNRVSINAKGSYRTSRGMQWDIAIADLSEGGCRVFDPHGRLKLGEYVRLFIAGTGPHMAEVAWMSGESVGFSFHRPLAERVFQLLASAEWERARHEYQNFSGLGGARRFV